jgi:predicted TIM-barrel fold metal-dependent hydrolase
MGSDWPFAAYEDRMTYAKALANFETIVPDVSHRRAMDHTALKLYFG